jgi:hypothetical protein
MLVLLTTTTAPVAPPRMPVVPLVAMCLVLATSLVMYWLIVRYWTSRRQWVSLAQWSRESGFRLRPARRDVLPEPLVALVRSDAQVRFHLCDERHTIVQFETEPLAATAATTASQPQPQPQPQPPPPPPRPWWNVIIRHRPGTGPIAGLRPAAQRTRLIDLLPLSKFPAMTLGDRFIVYAEDARAARELAESPLPSLLPPDMGLILFENHVVLDFSTRPFDPIEFGRLISLSDQLAGVIV